MKLLSICSCGAATVEWNGAEYCCQADDLEKYFPDLVGTKPEIEVGGCNYCINHWGLDLCGCGSGEKFGECTEGYEACQRRAQDLELGVAACYCESGW